MIFQSLNANDIKSIMEINKIGSRTFFEGILRNIN